MSTILSLGFLVGLRHALEADHVAAVVSLFYLTTSIKEGTKLGTVWGLGHTLTFQGGEYFVKNTFLKTQKRRTNKSRKIC